MNDIIYFELNNWFAGRDYPAEQPFISWLSDDLNIRLRNDDWAKENKICILASNVDMSSNFCITATRKWVEENCPKLLIEYTKFLREPNKYGIICGQFGTEFLEYEEENFGVKWFSEDGEDEDALWDDEDE